LAETRGASLQARQAGRRPVPRRLALLVCTLAALAAGPAADFVANLARLQQMPLSVRRHLAENLRRFDALPAYERAAIEEIDRSIAGLSPVDRLRYFGLLRWYHDWLDGQDPSVRAELATLEPSQRLKQVEAERVRQRPRREMSRGRLAGFNDLLQVSALVTESLRVSAIESRLWFMLPPEQRQKVVAKTNARAQREFLQDLVEKEPQLSGVRQRLSDELGIDVKEIREAVKRGVPSARSYSACLETAQCFRTWSETPSARLN
jgi:hypothetical protein